MIDEILKLVFVNNLDEDDIEYLIKDCKSLNEAVKVVKAKEDEITKYIVENFGE